MNTEQLRQEAEKQLDKRILTFPGTDEMPSEAIRTNVLIAMEKLATSPAAKQYWQQQSGSAGVWVRASERLPEIGQIKFSRIKGHLMSLIQVSINTGKIHFAGVLRPTEYSYSDIEWLDESLPDEKDKEIERLKELIETLYKAKASEGKLESEIEPAWQQFKTDNNL